MIVPILCCVGLVGVLLIVKHLRWVNDNLGLPEPSGKHPLLGFLPLFAEYANKDTLDTLIANLFKEVPQKTIHLPGSFAFKYVGTRDLDFIKMIFTDIDTFISQPGFRDPFSVVSPSGLLITSGATWKRHRKLAQSAFLPNSLRHVLKVTNQMMDKAIDKWASNLGSERELHAELSAFTLDVVAATSFSVDLNSFVDTTSHNEFAINTDHITTGVSKRISIPRPLWNLALKDSKQFNESAAYFRNYIRGVIEKRRREEAEGKGAKDLMSAMFQAQEDGEAPMTDDEILDETIMFFLAGHETSSNTLCWALYALSQHPNALEKLIEEVDRVLGSRDPEWEDLPKLKYMDAVLKEALRVYNTVPLTGRIALRDIEFKGTRIPKGTQLVLFLQGVHTDPEIFPEPDLFKPERWEGPDASSLPFLAFGYGARMCIGRKFAWTEMQVALARMLQHFTFELVPGQTIERIHSITSGPKHGIRFIFKPRL